MSRQDQRKSLADWSANRTVIRGPYAEGEGSQDQLDQLESRRTAKLVWRVFWTMLSLIVLYVVGYLIFQ